MWPSLKRCLFSTDPKLHRMLLYWGSSGLFYALSLLVLQPQVRAGGIDPQGAAMLAWFAGTGVMVFFVLVRFSIVLSIPPRHLAVLQALFGFACNLGAYALTGPVRGATLMVMLVIMVFCTFSLRPRATKGLCVAVIAGLAVTIMAMVTKDPVRYPVEVELVHFLLASSALVAVTLLTGEMSKLRASLKQQKQDLMAAVGTIRTLATMDELTELANRRYMNEVLSAEERRQPAPDRPMCIALIDIDFFKSVNDRFGHDGGDAVLRSFAASARAELRTGDVLARWGGEEFLLMLPGTEIEEAQQVLRRMAASMRAIAIPGLDLGRGVTFSGGVVRRIGSEPFSDTISRADKAMYAAKSSGRDKIVAG